MARPPSLEISTVDSTSLLFAGLDLFEPKPENMDFMDIDQVMDVPDTPDRLTSRQKISLNVSGDAANGDLLNRGILNGLRGSRRLNINNGNSKNSYSRRQRDLDDHNEIKHGSSLIDSAADSASVSDGFDKPTMRLADQISKRNETKLSAQTQHTESAPYQNKPLLRIPSGSQWSTDHLVDRSKLCSSTSDINGSSASDVKIHGGNRGRTIGLSQKIPSDSFFPTKIKDARRRMLPCHGNSSSEKDLCTEIPPRSFTWQDADHVLDSSERHEYTGKPERPCSIGRFEKVGAKEVGTGSVISSGSIRESRSKSQATHGLFPLYDADNYSKSSGNARKRETDGTFDGAGVSMNHVNVNAELMGNGKGKGIDLFHKPPPKTAQSASISLTVTSPRKTGQRRLVRNGCISPYNIAKSKSTSENYCRNVRDDKQDENDKRTCNDLPDGNSSCQVHIISPGSEGNQIDKMKGKGIVNEHMPENDCDARTKSLSSRNFSIPREKDSGIGDDAIGDIFRSAEVIGGWRNTRNRLKAAYLPSSHDIGGHSTINNGGCDSFNQSHGGKMEDGNYVTEVNASPEFDFHKDGDPIILQHVGPNTRPVQASSSVISESNPENNERQKGKQKLMKRQRKTPASCNNLGECSSSTFDGPEVSFLRSSGQPSNVKPTRTRNSQRRGNLIPVIEVDEPCSPEAIFIDQQDAGRLVNDDSGTKARQVEADEILARHSHAGYKEHNWRVSRKFLDAFRTDPFRSLVLQLEHLGLLTERIRTELSFGAEYWALERKLCHALINKKEILIEDVMRAIHLKSFDYRVLNLLLYRLRELQVNDLHMEFLSVSEFLVEVSDDLFDYEDDVIENNFNILRMFVAIYGASMAPRMLAKCISEAEEKYESLLEALDPDLSSKYKRRCEEATKEGGKVSGHAFGTWSIPPLIADEESYRSGILPSKATD